MKLRDNEPIAIANDVIAIDIDVVAIANDVSAASTHLSGFADLPEIDWQDAARFMGFAWLLRAVFFRTASGADLAPPAACTFHVSIRS